MKIAKNKHKTFLHVVALLSVCLFSYLLVLTTIPAIAATGINEFINFQGKVVNSNGTNVANGSYTFRFRFYTASSGDTGDPCATTCVWEESKSVTVTDGIFQTNLGDTTTLPGSVDFNTDNIYLSVKFHTETGEMSPRIRMTSVPQAHNADKLDGLDSSAFITLGASQTFTGANIFQPTTNINGLTVKQTSFGSPTADIFEIMTANNSSIFEVTGPAANEAAVTLQSLGATRGLTFSSGTGSIDFTSDSLTSVGTNITATAGLTVGATGSNNLVLSAGTGSVTLTGSSGLVTLNSGSGSIAFSSDSLTGIGTDITASAALTVASGGASGLTLDSASNTLTVAASDTALTASGVATVTLAANASITNASGIVTIQPAGSGTISRLQIGAGGSGSATPDFLGLDVFNGTAGTDPAGGAEGYMYYHTTDNKFRCFTGAAWADCGGSGSSQWTTVGSDIEYGSGDVIIGDKADATAHNFASGCSCSLTSAAGTFGSQTIRDAVTQAVTYKGKLFVAVRETDAAGVYRYDGGTTWTLVTNAVGEAASDGSDATNIDDYVMTVFNGKLYIGSKTGASTGAVYVSSTAHTTANSFTLVNATRGTFASAGADGVSDMVVWRGSLIIATQEPNLAEIVRYDGGTTFAQITPTDGKSVAESTADKDGFLLAVYRELLISGSISGSTTAIVAAYAGNGTTWVHLHGTTGGGALGAETAYIDITSMVVWNGALYVAASKANAAAVYVYKGTGAVANVAANFLRVTTTVGKMVAADAANIDGIVLRRHNGRLFAGTQTATGENTAALYEYPGVPGEWTLINTTRGTFGGTTGVNSISSMATMNNSLYIGTDEPDAASAYIWSSTSQNSHSLYFDSGNANYGGISFTGATQVADNAGHSGTFLFTNAITTASGAFDYAEDYPTYDYSLEAGDIVSIDPQTKEYVEKARRGSAPIGIYSANPGFRLEQAADKKQGELWVPIALVGRVPVKVSGENGPIAPGDYLALSSIPGVAMKATKAGAVVGKAMEAYSEAGVGQVMAFVETGTFNGAKLMSLPGLEQRVNEARFDPTLLRGLREAEGLDHSQLSEVLTDRLVAGDEVLTPLLVADEIRAGSIKADRIEGLELLVGNLVSLKESSAEADADEPTTTAESTAEPAADTAPASAPSLEELGKLHVKGGLTVDGEAAFNGRSIFTALAEFYGRVNFSGQVSFKQPLSLNQDSAGIARIKAGASRVDIVFTQPYAQPPHIVSNLAIQDKRAADGSLVESAETIQLRHDTLNYRYHTANVTARGFTILLNQPAQETLTFNWLAASVTDAKISESTGAQGQ